MTNHLRLEPPFAPWEKGLGMREPSVKDLYEAQYSCTNRRLR